MEEEGVIFIAAGEPGVAGGAGFHGGDVGRWGRKRRLFRIPTVSRCGCAGEVGRGLQEVGDVRGESGEVARERRLRHAVAPAGARRRVRQVGPICR